jgi:hypothetical protein
MAKRKPSDLVSDAKQETTEVAVAKSKSDTAKWRAKYNDAVKHAVNVEGQLDFLLNIRGKPKKKAIRAKRSKKGRGVAVIAPATDWHVEETVYAARTNGKNEFNIAEAERRIKQYYQKVLQLIHHQNSLAPVVELWHPLLGDLLSGYIHEELMETNGLSPTEACYFLKQMITAGINLWLRETDLPIFIPTCVGNHARTTPKKQIKTSCMNSFEWLLYKTMADQYADNPRVEWMVGEGYHNIQEIQGRKVRFHHGDGLRYQGGVGGITIPVNKSIAQWNKVEHVDLDVFGHWHTFLQNYPDWISCGCLIGYTEYAVEIKANFQHPTQTFIVIDELYGVTSVAPIFLTEPQRRKAKK